MNKGIVVLMSEVLLLGVSLLLGIHFVNPRGQNATNMFLTLQYQT